MVNEVGRRTLPASAQAQYLSTVAPDPVVLDAGLQRSLRDFLNNIPRFLSDYDEIGGSAAGCAALRTCQSRIERVANTHPHGPVECDQILSELAQAAQSLDEAKREVIDQIPELVPGSAEKVLADFGMLFGLIASAAIFFAAPYLAPVAAGVWVASFFGQGWAIEREDARENLVDIFAPQLEMIRSATVRAQSAYTIEYLKARVTEDAAAHYAASLAPLPSPPGRPSNDALSGTASLPPVRVMADTVKSPLCLVLLKIQTGAISIPDEPASVRLLELLDLEAKAEQQGPAASDQGNEAIRKQIRTGLDGLRDRPPAMHLILEGEACTKGIWANDPEFNHRVLGLRGPIESDKQRASVQDQRHHRTAHAKRQLGVPGATAQHARRDVEAASERPDTSNEEG